jgi:PAS domain S-box-containing protein
MKTLLKSAPILLVTLLICAGTVCSQAQGADVPPASYPPFPEQGLRFEHLTVQDGLSEGRVWGITQDRKGFMWFTTWDGLNRYDGYEFKVYKQEPGNPKSPGGTAFWVVYEDRAGTIWAGSPTGGGLSRYDPTNEQWVRYQHDPDDPHSLGSDNVYAIYEDSAGVLWIGTEGGGLNLFEGAAEDGRGRFTRYEPDPEDPQSLGSAFVSSIYEDRSGVLWIGTYDGGLHRYNRERESFTRYQHDANDPESLSDDRVYPIYEDRSGMLWVGTYGGGLNRFDRETGRFKRYRSDPDDPHNLSGDTITGICEDPSGTLWIGTFDGGLNRYQPETDTFVSYQHDALDPRSLGSSTVASLYVDRSGTLWIGTGGSGISKLDPTAQGFGLYRHKPTDPNSLNNSDVRAIYEDRSGDLWIGTWGGLNRLDPKTGRTTHYRHDPADPDSLSDDHVLSIHEDNTGTLWVGVDTHGLNKYNRETETFAHFRPDPADPHSLSDGVVTTLYQDRTGVLWVGTFTSGLDALDPQSQDEQVRFSHHQHDPEDPHSLGAGTIYAIHEDREGVLWVGTGGGGLCRYDRDRESFACYRHDPDDANSLTDNVIWAIYPDREGGLWVGTSGGLNRLDAITGIFLHYTTADGLPHNTVYGILEDTSSPGTNGQLWLSTAGGLSRFDPRSRTFRNYGASDGLQGDGFNFGAYHKSSTGELFYGGPNGLTTFHPQDIRSNTHIPPVFVTGFHLTNEPVPVGNDSPLQQSIVDTEELALSFQDRVISFQFAALNYSSPLQNRYRYKLEGFEDDWTEVGSDRRYATYTNLDPGHYTFRVLGSNNDGVWNEVGASLAITITPPWWASWWFRGALLLLGVATLAGGYRWRVRAWERRSRELERQVAERTTELGERVKELNCLFGISQLAGTQGVSLEEILRGTVELIPPAWQVPDSTGARITLGNQCFATDNWRGTPWLQTRDILVHGTRAGAVEVCYLGEGPRHGTTPFVQEEELLLGAIAERLGRIVERMRTEQALQHSREQYALAQRAANIGTWDWDLTTGDVYWSEEIERMFGLEPEASDPMFSFAPGEFETTYPAFLNSVHPEDRPYVADAIYACMEQAAFVSIEHRIVWPDGTVRWVAETGDVLRDAAGQATRMLGVVRDITERRRIQEELRASEEEYRDLVENISDVIYALDLEGRVTYISPVVESLLGYSVPEVLGQPFAAYIHPEDLTYAQARFEQLATGQASRPNQYRVVAKSGEARWIRVSSQPILKEGRQRGVRGVLTDITDGVRAGEQAEQAAAAAERERLARDLHDAVTQTLFSASAIASVLPEVWERYPDEARRGLVELRRLTRGALAEMRTLLLELRPTSLLRKSLGELLHQLADAMMSRTQTSIALAVRGERELPDEVQVALYRIAQEALNNVVKHAQASHAAMELYNEPERVTLHVRDDGRGFDPNEAKTGRMGLGIMRERAEGIGAQVTLQSQPGEGTEITVTWRDLP